MSLHNTTSESEVVETVVGGKGISDTDDTCKSVMGAAGAGAAGAGATGVGAAGVGSRWEPTGAGSGSGSIGVGSETTSNGAGPVAG